MTKKHVNPPLARGKVKDFVLRWMHVFGFGGMGLITMQMNASVLTELVKPAVVAPRDVVVEN